MINKPFIYEYNLILEIFEFHDEIYKTKDRFGNEHKGKIYMEQGKINISIIGDNEFNKLNKKNIL